MQFERGKQVYMQLCFACHMPDGKGLPSVFPPLAGSDYMLGDRARAIRVALKGMTGPVTVNGQSYDSAMPPTGLTEEQITDVLTYTFNAWGNSGEPFTVDEVRRALTESR
jgi:nitrite reductase (NO-forming)